MTKNIKTLVNALQTKQALKVIAGINNFNKARVLQIAKAAQQAGAHCVDICAQEDIVTEVLASCPNIAVAVSSVKPAELLRAAELGAEMLELGNFEALHEEGVFPTATEIRAWTREIMTGLDELMAKGLLRGSAARNDSGLAARNDGRPLVSITVPGHLEMLEQINLAEWLEAAGVNVIQTEGASLVDTNSAGALGQIEKVKLTLASTVELSRVVSERCYLLTASGLTPDTANLAIAAGAHGIGVGKYVNKLESSLEMLAAITALREAIASKSTVTALV